MNFWATIEHSLNYKYQGVFPEEMSERLQRAAEAAYQLDEEMSNIREEIQEAQRLFSHGRGKSDDIYYRTLLTREKLKEEAKDEGSDRS